jgi:hypothetical protein
MARISRCSAAPLAGFPAVLLLACSALAASGCGSTAREYRPRTDLVAQMGVVETAQALQRALEDVQAPVITAVRFGVEHLAFTCQPSSIRDARFSTQHQVIRTFRCHQPEMLLDLRDLTRIDVLQPQYFLVLRSSAGAHLVTLMPDSRDHALRLVDLLASVRTAVDDAQSMPFPPLVVGYVRETRQSTGSGQTE